MLCGPSFLGIEALQTASFPPGCFRPIINRQPPTEPRVSKAGSRKSEAGGLWCHLYPLPQHIGIRALRSKFQGLISDIKCSSFIALSKSMTATCSLIPHLLSGTSWLGLSKNFIRYLHTRMKVSLLLFTSVVGG
jgi:hypothetical protein